MKRYFLLMPLLAVLAAGCASKQPTIGAWRGDGFSPAPTDKIALTYRPNPSPEDAQLGQMLTNELQRMGFNLVPQAEADYTLVYAVEDDSTETYIPRRDFGLPLARPTEIGPTPMSNQTRFGLLPTGFTPAPSTGPTVVVFYSKGIHLYLYTNPVMHSGKFETAWSGCIEAGENISAKREPALIEALLEHFGQDFVGQTTLDK